MWIVTKDLGLFNLGAYAHISAVGNCTYAFSADGNMKRISNTNVEAIIAAAIRRGDNYVEVE